MKPVDVSVSTLRETFSHLSDLEWLAVGRMVKVMGDKPVTTMLCSLRENERHAAIAQFIQHELDEALKSNTLLHEQGAQQRHLLGEIGAQHTEVLRQQQASAAGSVRTHRPETLKVDISKYRGVEADSLLRWFVELDDAIQARRIEDDAMKVPFAMSNLAGRAKDWALGLQLHDSYAFES